MPEVVGFVAAVHQDEPGFAAVSLPPGINEPGVLMVVVESANFAGWHGSQVHNMEPYGWHWLGASGYCCTAPSAGLSVCSRKTTEYDTFVGDGTDTVDWWVATSSWQRKWIAIWAIRDADGPIAQIGQSGALPGGPVITPPWSDTAPAMSLSGIIFPYFGSLGSIPVNYAQDGAVFVDTIDNPSGPDYGGFYSYVAHWSHTMSPPEASPDWYINGIDPGELGFYTPSFHVIVPEAGRGVCYSDPTWDVGKNLLNPPYWQSRCWEQRGPYAANVPLTLSGVGTLRLTGTYDWTPTYDDPGSDINSGGVYQCRWPFAPPGPYDTPHAARIRFRWHPVGTILGDISQRSLRYAIANTGFRGGAHIHFPTTADPNLRLTTGPWDDPTNALISSIAPDTDHILEVDFLKGDVRVKLALAEDIDTGPFLSDPPLLTVPYHDPFDDGESPNVSYPVMQVDMTCSTDDIFDIEDINVLFGPSVGMRFEILVGFGDDSTITFRGWPTQAGTAKWFVSGSEVEPESVDEYAGTATFTRPPPPDAAVQQQGVYAGS